MEKLGAGDPQRIGAYRLLARLGAGGMGQVYLARSDRGRTVAVKLVRQELAEQEEFRNRFRLEVRAARQVGGEWTAPVLDADTEADIPWVATGYVAGPSLQTVVSHDHGALPERSVRILAAGLTHALKDIHTAGLIHRDLKPSNVLVTIDGPRVIDFGIARALETVTDGGLTRTGALVGSPGFMAPEQVRGDRITPACDVFCLGSVLAYAASGALPFGTANSGVHALMFRIAQEEPDLEGLPEGLQELVRDCLHKEPSARPTLDQLLERTGAEDTLGDGGRTRDPWLPGALVAQLGRHAVQLLDTEDPDGATGATGAAGATSGKPPVLSKEKPAPATPAETGDGEPTPPPPGKPGAAPVNHLPTMVSPSGPSTPALPPAAPPASSAYGYPHPHPQAPVYGYPQQSGWGGTPPYGPAATPPYGPGVVPIGAPQPEPRRSGRSTAALIVVALVVALGAGGSVYALMKDDGKPASQSEDSKQPSSGAPTSQGPSTGGPSSQDPGTSQPPESSEPPAGGDVPPEFLGTWSASIDNATGHNTRRLDIQQGGPGDTVLSMTADGPLKGGGTYHCVFQGALVSASGGTLHIGATDVVSGPAGSCSPGKPSMVELTSSGELRRTMNNGDELTYSKGG
ncbi:protein kinase [Streptomyces sp. NBC_01474]|uniref:serine/threonine-protein kinase n=1 Tax=unclassified Streptomyces TaxID=2593676 RepID=UPI002DD8C2DD|nr:MULTISPECIES: protein kinase [unclassified Streptomyces]WSD97047.1 protein kinase [Streptomyces sp. NBC_01474]